MKQILVFSGSGLESYTENQRFFIKFFLLDASLNKNGWMVSWQAIQNRINDFVGKPFIILPNFSHPQPRNPDDMFQAQKPYTKGNIYKVGLDSQAKKAWAIAEITDKEAILQIKNGQIKYVSPSMLAWDYDVQYMGNTKMIMDFEAAHVAGVDNPAYGIISAQIKGQCSCASGDCEYCERHLAAVQAAVTSEDITNITQEVLLQRISEKKGRIKTTFKLLQDLVSKYGAEPEDNVIEEEITGKRSNLEYMIIDLMRLEKAKRGEVQANVQKLHADSKCVSDCLQSKSDAGIEIDDQAIAICYSECYDSNQGSVMQGASTTVQTYIFDKEKFTREEAKNWLEKHDKNTGLEETEDSFRARQVPPGDFNEGSFRTIQITSGIKAVIGKLKSDNQASQNIASYDSYKGEKHKKKTGMDGDTITISKEKVEAMEADLKTIKDELKASKDTYKAESDNYKKEIQTLKQANEDEKKKSLVASIVEAKTKLGIKADKEEETLMKLSFDELKSMSSEYDLLSKTRESGTRFPYSAAIDDKDTKKGDSFLAQLHSGQRSSVN